MVSELGKTKFSTWTREVAEWAIPYAGCGGISFEEKSYALLRLAVPGSPACRLFANRIEKVQTQGLELNFINGKYAGEDATEFTVFASPLSAVGAAEAWIILVAELRAALPTDLASDEQKLRREKMRPKEKLEHFTTRFCQAADQMDKLAETVKCSILYSHLPKSAQELVRSLPKSSTTLKAMLERLHESLAWDSGGGAVGSAADPMEIDTVNVQSVIQGERVEFSAIKTMQDFRMASRHLARRNQGYRNFLQDVLRDGARGTQRQGRFQNRPWQRPKNYRQGQTEREKIFNIDVPVFEDALFGGDVDTNQGDTEEQSQGVNTVKMTSSGSLLFCPAVINAQVTCNGLIDTGAGVSLISAKIAKLAGAIPQPTERVLRCANQSALTCLGTAQVTLTIGQTSLQQWVFVCPELGYDMILGNDVLCELKAKPNPAHRVLELPRQPAVQCLAVAPESVGDQGFVWRLTAAEPLPVQPVVKDGVLFCALGSSRVIAAQSTLTVVLPIVPSTSVAFFDSGRLPAGVSASSAIWMRGHSLRVTLTNATATPVMLGSRTAIAGVLLAATTVELKQADGIVRTLATYSPPTTPATMVANVRPCAADLPSQFPALFASTVGSFKPEVIEELPFVSTPSTLAPPQPPLVGQEFLAAQQQITTWTKQGVLRPVSWTPRAPPDRFSTPEFCRDWDTVVTRLTSALWRLHYWQPHSNEPLRLYVDSSSLAHGALLVQGQRLVAMWSAYNTQPFRSSNFSELRGFCRAVTALRAFLINQKFDIYTDNRTVVAMFSATSSTDFIRRQLAQVQDLFVYPLRVHHIAGQENFLADLLSRQRYLVERSEVCPVEAGNQELCLKRELEKEEQWKGVLQAAQLCYKHQLVWKNGMLQKWMDSDYKVVIPRSMVKTVLETCHDKAGHFGVEKTLERMRRSFFWTDMRKDAEAHCRTCDTCQRFGKLRKTASSLSIPTERPMQVVAVDFVGPLDISGVHKYILVGVDFFSRWIEAKPVSSATSDQLVHFVEAWRHKWGRIESLMGDNGGAFGSSYFAKYLTEKKIEKVEISSYSPKSNGRVERANQTLVHRLQRMCWKDKSRWSEFVTKAVELMRDSRSSVLGFSPREILLGKNAQGEKVDVLEIRRKIRDLEKQMGEKQVTELDPQKFLEKEIVNGGLVLVRNNLGDGVHGQKFEPKWKGPYRVRQKKGNRLFELETIEGVKIKGVFHHDRLRQYFKR
ncbi:hypothetical protein BSKO_04318 [Bryopsis sp. KO-2023]|nr:hypothetical protein BSKO_04318 [Bryopsis sp. KO-2023]